MQVDWASAGFFRVKINFPKLAERIRLDKVPFVVNVKAMIDRLALEVGNKSGDIDDCHVLHTTVNGDDSSSATCL